MANFWNTIGITMTGFLKGLSGIWSWLTETNLWTWDGVTYTPLGLFGIGLGAIIAVIIIKEIIF